MEIDRELLRKLPLEFRMEVEENIMRKSFTETELAAIQEQMIKILSPPDRVERTRKTNQEGSISPSKDGVNKKFTCADTTKTVAGLFGESEATVRRRAAIVHAAAAEPGRFGKLAEDMDRTGKVDGVHKRLKTARAAESIRAEPPVLPEGPFRVIVCDPPWKYDLRDKDPTHRAVCPYPSMTIEEIKALDVEARAHEDCVLWLWTTNAHIREAFGIIDAWGFTYKTILTWGKDRMGVGNWLRGQTEHCLMAVRGKPVIQLTNQTTLLHGPLRNHSQKPEEFYQLIETLCPGSKLEMFSRQKREGWIGYGDES